MPAVQYPDLSQMFGQYSMYPTTMGLDREAVAQQNNQINQATTLQDMLLKQQQEARLGKESEARMALEKANADKLRQQLDQAAKLSQFKTAGEMAQALEQWGNIAKNNPKNPGEIPLEIQHLVPEGIRSVFTTPEGWQYAIAAGQAYRENSAKWLKEAADRSTKENVAATNADPKYYAADEATTRAREANASRERIAAMRTEAQKLMADKRGSANDKQSLEQYITALDRQRANTPMEDHDTYQRLTNRMAEAQTRLERIRAAGAAEQSSLPRELVGKPKPQTAPQAAPAAPATAERVRVTSPDGKTGTVPKSQLQDALSQGYKEVK